MKRNSDTTSPLVIGITGGVGSGKSQVLSYLSTFPKVCVYQLDEIAHQLQVPGTTCYQNILSYFGEDILQEDGTLNRMRLGEIVFQTKEKLQALNEIVHPEVKKYVCRLIESRQDDIIVIESAILIEAGYQELCTELWFIDTCDEVRTQRLITSRSYKKEKINQMIEHQLSKQVFRSVCDVVIDNSKDLDNLYKTVQLEFLRFQEKNTSNK